MLFGHVLTAMVTPFDINGQIDFEKMTILIEHLLNNGTDGLVINGTTAESAVLTMNEKKQIYKHVIAAVNKRVPVIAGTGTNDTKHTIESTKIATQYGVDGIMLVAPYYNRPNQQGLYTHFSSVAYETDLPIMLYNNPNRCGVHIESETMIRLSEISNIVALKEASGNIDYTSEVIAHTNEDFHVYSGDDSMTLPILSVGGNGVVSVASHVIGKELHEMVTSFLAGDVKKAADIHLENLPIMKGIFMTASPAPIKAALKLIGMDVGTVKLPLVDLTADELNQLNEIIHLKKAASNK